LPHRTTRAGEGDDALGDDSRDLGGAGRCRGEILHGSREALEGGYRLQRGLHLSVDLREELCQLFPDRVAQGDELDLLLLDPGDEERVDAD
jgi:hypothetical protein